MFKRYQLKNSDVGYGMYYNYIRDKEVGKAKKERKPNEVANGKRIGSLYFLLHNSPKQTSHLSTQRNYLLNFF